ncbi:MAG: hydroxyacylglutathione hydrolase family protein [Anaerolineae bacterium]|jgi:glyoxylase-like metal-dependent hydrolase (beta-lactamase superfamily II)
MFVQQFATGGDRNFGYLVADEDSNQAAIVDASYSPQSILDFARERGYRVVYAFSTHAHGDHTNGNPTVEAALGKPVLLYGHRDPDTGVELTDGARLPLGNLTITIIYTPGHTDDSMCLYVGDALFTGDTLFVGKVGGTDLGEGARKQYHSLHERIMRLPDTTVIYPGHNVGVAPVSTVAHERETNPFLLQPDFEAFVHLKANWAAYKAEHGIK